MADDTQSRQEDLMKIFCGRLMAAPFVFAPELWRLRPGKTREPADLIWACNNCVILMNMTAGKAFQGNEKSKRTFQDRTDHNLRQANQRLKTWKVRPISGKNAWHRFCLLWKKTTRIVVLSVVKTGPENLSQPAEHAFAEVHTAWAQKKGVALCATVSQRVIEHLAGIGGSALDLLLMLEWYRHFGTVPEQQAIEMINAYQVHSLELCKDLDLAEHGLPELDNKSTALFAVMCMILAQTRHRPTRMRGDEAPLAVGENIGTKYGILADMLLVEFYCIAKVIAACLALMESSGSRVYRNLTLLHYEFRICAVDSAADEAFCKEDFKVWSAPRKEGAMRPGLYFRYNRALGQLGCWPVTRFGPSLTEQVLDIIRQTPPVPPS